MKSTFFLWTLLALFTAAQNGGLPASGPEKPGVGNTPEALQISESAGRHPNATTSVTFSRTYNNTPETWTWRVNVTDIGVPDRISDLGSPSATFSQGLHVANTQWELDWPTSNDSLQSFLAERNMTVSFTTLISNKPSNITDNYHDEDNGSCTSILGDSCTQSLTEAASKGSVNFLGLQGCENSLAVNEGGQDDGAGFNIAPQGSNSSDFDSTVLHRGDTLFYRTSDVYMPGDLTFLNKSESALQVFVMNVEYGNGDRGDTSGPTVLCRIVNNTAKAPESAAIGWHQPMAVVWGAMILSILAIMCG